MEDELETTSGGESAPTRDPDNAAATKPEVDPATTALVKQWCEWIKDAKQHHEPKFKRIRKWQQVAEEGAEPEWVASGAYVVPVVLRHINTAVATLYAKNPKVVAKRKRKLLYQIWDGTNESLQAAIVGSQPQIDPVTGMPIVDPMTGQPIVDPNAVAIINEVAQARQQMLMYDRLGKTLELLFDYYLNEQDAGYREEIKALVRRAKVCYVGYLKLGYQRRLGKNPDKTAAIADSTSQLQAIEALLQESKSSDIEADSAKAAELKSLIETLQSEETIILREGPVLSFPRATEVIPDKKCRNLKTFAGCRWVAQEFHYSKEEALKYLGVDLNGHGYTKYSSDGNANDKGEYACFWEVFDKENKQSFVVCDGYSDFVQPPATPFPVIERFWPWFPLVFNQSENEKSPFGLSDVGAAMHMQQEYNQSREARRQHRISALPRYVVPAGRLSDADKVNLATAVPNTVIELQQMSPADKMPDILQRVPAAEIDERLYETETIFADIQRAVGTQEANFGNTTGATATETSIAENSRMTASGDNTDDLDTMLTAFARAMGQVMLMNLDKQTVIEICGPGAVWPDLPPTREEVAKDLYLDIVAGSSGRPNAAAELANLERILPQLVLLPGVNPEPIVKKVGDALEIDFEELYVEGAPSITAMNGMAGTSMQAGGGLDSPNAQGGEGGDNAEQPPADEPNSQPAFPAPMAVAA